MSLTRFWAGAGLTLGLRRGWRSLAIAIAAGLGFGAWMALADSALFASVIPPSQVALLAMPMDQLLRLLPVLLLYDEVLLRLLTLPLLIHAFRQLTGREDAYWPAILIVACLFWPLSARDYLATLDMSALSLLREVTLHCAAGTLWGWLCWRHGWLAGLAGHVAAYGTFLPLMAP